MSKFSLCLSLSLFHGCLHFLEKKVDKFCSFTWCVLSLTRYDFVIWRIDEDNHTLACHTITLWRVSKLHFSASHHHTLTFRTITVWCFAPLHFGVLHHHTLVCCSITLRCVAPSPFGVSYHHTLACHIIVHRSNHHTGILQTLKYFFKYTKLSDRVGIKF
jgi:hypothetical protein